MAAKKWKRSKRKVVRKKIGWQLPITPLTGVRHVSSYDNSGNKLPGPSKNCGCSNCRSAFGKR